ncbi:MAG: D-glycero-beta-D-manno-heptose-7-phosphate kinase [Armatimonadetes bacterium]|nr:D-glycero-beta-D-manno-heptose-7-phosphate kinase [Armatimonadota bacterium]
MRLAEVLDRIKGCRAAVIGDVMLDEYLFGTAARISPEAPVMVIRRIRDSHAPGGAANVAHNIAALGGTAFLVGVIGDDEPGQRLSKAHAPAGVTHRYVVDKDRPTTCKTRVVADQAHQVLRIDTESEQPLTGKSLEEFLNAALKAVDDADVVVLSDYMKGALNHEVCAGVIERAKARGIPVVANPKPKSARQMKGASLISLNRREASDLMDGELGEPALAAKKLAAGLGVEHVLITLGGEGMVAGPETIEVDAHHVEVYDPAGAGDTAIATVALGFARCGYTKAVFELAAATAAAVVRHVGVTAPSAEDLARIREV